MKYKQVQDDYLRSTPISIVMVELCTWALLSHSGTRSEFGTNLITYITLWLYTVQM